MTDQQIIVLETVLVRGAQAMILCYVALTAYMGFQVRKAEAKTGTKGPGAYIPRMLRAHRALFPGSRLRMITLGVVVLCIGLLSTSGVLIHREHQRLAAIAQADR